MPAVVLCKPLGHEALATHSTYRYLAERLSEAGFPVLRFDYDGTGDSFGDDADPERVQSWIRSIGYAVDALRVASGRSRTALFGIRMGATLAAIAASERGDIDALVLWAAFRNGGVFLRETRALNSMGSGSAPMPEAPPDYLEAAGFVYSAETAARLSALDACAVQNCPAARILYIDRDDMSGEKRLRARLTTLGATITEAALPGYRAMMHDPQDAEPPVEAVNHIVGWLQTAIGPESPLSAPLPRPAACCAAIRSRLDGSGFVERAIRPEESGGVFGLLTNPAASPESKRPTILLLSVGANPHIGPNRMYVPLARTLAQAGFPVVRFDVPGVGDSASGADTAGEAIYAPSAAESVRRFIAQYPSGSAESFVLVGLCSGAYSAFKTAVDDPRVVGQILINPQTFEWKHGDSLQVRMRQSYRPTRFYVASLRDPQTLKRILYREVNLRGVTGILVKRTGEGLGRIARDVLHVAVRRRRYATPVCRDFHELSRRGTRTFFVFAHDDFGIEMVETHLGARGGKVAGGHSLEWEVIEAADHTFTPKIARERLLASVSDYVLRTFSSTPTRLPDGKK